MTDDEAEVNAELAALAAMDVVLDGMEDMPHLKETL